MTCIAAALKATPSRACSMTLDAPPGTGVQVTAFVAMLALDTGRVEGGRLDLVPCLRLRSLVSFAARKAPASGVAPLTHPSQCTAIPAHPGC